MERFVKGQVVVIPFPFSDLSNSKKRPALVLANQIDEDILLCQITSKDIKDQFGIRLLSSHFIDGELPLESVIRPNRIFKAHASLIEYVAGRINTVKMRQARDQIVEYLDQ